MAQLTPGQMAVDVVFAQFDIRGQAFDNCGQGRAVGFTGG
jgi:hypothetical protein